MRRDRDSLACIELDHHVLALAIRFVHIAAMAAIFGGALLVSWLATRSDPGPIVEIAIRYEQAFWAAAGVLVMTGIGNLGAFGATLPQPNTAWGTTFQTKMLLVAVLILLSLPRSLVVAQLAERGAPDAPILGRSYPATTVVLAAIVALATVLAHG